MGRFLTVTYTWARRCVVALIGGTVVFIGVLMIVFPGPAFIVIPAGLAILGLEFACARRWLKQVRTTGAQVLGRTRLWLKPSVQTSQAHRPAHRDARAAPHSFDARQPVCVTERTKANTKTGYSRSP